MIPEDEFYDAVDATLDKLEKEEEKVSAVIDYNLEHLYGFLFEIMFKFMIA